MTGFYRKFGRKTLRITATMATKSKAEMTAKTIRGKGYNARVIKAPRKWSLTGDWAVYTTNAGDRYLWGKPKITRRR